MNKKQSIYQKAKKAWNEGNYQLSFKLYKKCAKMKFTPAYFDLGYMYDDGIGTKVNKDKALYWYKKSEKHGEHCHNNIASIYAVYRNRDKERYWYKKGIQRKDSSAMFNMAIFYREKNCMKKMQKWFKKSFKQDDGSAAYELARIYLSKVKIKKAIKYLKIAIEHQHITLHEREKSQLYLKRIKNFKKSR